MKISQKMHDAAAIAEEDEREGRQAGDDDLAERDAAGEEDAVDDLVAEIGARPCLGDVLRGSRGRASAASAPG